MGGASMDGKLLQQAAMAHHNALGSMDSNLVTTAADYQAVNAALGKVIASVPSSQVMDVFNAFSKITGPSVPSNLFSMVSPSEATAAYDAFFEIQGCGEGGTAVKPSTLLLTTGFPTHRCISLSRHLVRTRDDPFQGPRYSRSC